MDPTIADTTLHRLARMLPTPTLRAAAWPGSRGPGAARCTLCAADAHVRVRVERVSVAGAHLVAPTVGLVRLASPDAAGLPEPLQLRVQHPGLPMPLAVPCVLVGAAARGTEHALSVRFSPPEPGQHGLHAALQVAFEQRSWARHPVHEDVVPVVIQEAWRGRTLRGVMQDLSARGLCIVLDLGSGEGPAVGEPVLLQFRLPGTQGLLSLHAEVRGVRVRPALGTGHAGLVEVGLALTEAGPADQVLAERVQALLEGGPARAAAQPAVPSQTHLS